MIFRSFAKVNLHLEVLRRRNDGYHDLETVFQTVDLADRIVLDLIPEGIELTVSEGAAPVGEDNLAYRAARAYLRRWAPETGVRIDLKKRIPIGGGLGGGSSNAATVLMGLQRILGRPRELLSLTELAVGLGADVPFFLHGGTALGEGRGDRIQPFADLEEKTLLLVTPKLEISTAEVFGSLELEAMRRPGRRLPEGWTDNFDWQVVRRCWNDLEEPVLARFEVMRDVYNALVEAGATVARLSGTGATVFAVFEDTVDFSGLAAKLPGGSVAVQTRTLTRSSRDAMSVVE